MCERFGAGTLNRRKSDLMMNHSLAGFNHPLNTMSSLAAQQLMHPAHASQAFQWSTKHFIK